jgi:hypothetical protein
MNDVFRTLLIVSWAIKRRCFNCRGYRPTAPNKNEQMNGEQVRVWKEVEQLIIKYTHSIRLQRLRNTKQHLSQDGQESKWVHIYSYAAAPTY